MLYKIEPPFKVASLSFFHLRGIIVTKVIFFTRAPLPGLKRKYMNEMIYLFRIRSRSSSSCMRRFSFSAALSKK